MNGKSERIATRRDGPKERLLQSRLELIKKRHRELILVPREKMMDDFPFDVANEYDEELELSEIDVAYGLNNR